MKKSLLLLGVALVVAQAATPASAHRPWLLPSTTSVSGSDDWVTVDAAASNDVFFPNHFPLQLDEIRVWAPDGSAGQIQNGARGRYRATFDVELDKPGTWKIGTESSNVMGTYKVDGVLWGVGRRRGPPPGAMTGMKGGDGAHRAPQGEHHEGGDGDHEGGPRPAQSVASVADIPANATDLHLTEMDSSNQLFVTAGAPTMTVIKPSGHGLEMEPLTHPDALVSDTPAQFRFLVDGKPAAGLTVLVVPGGKRYREAEQAQTLTTDAQGLVSVRWPFAGMYWLNAVATDAHPSAPKATERRMSYTATLEVLAP